MIVTATTSEIRADFERTGVLAPMYARALFERLAEAERDRDFWEDQYDTLLRDVGGVSPG